MKNEESPVRNLVSGLAFQLKLQTLLRLGSHLL